jgi:uncharacterized membrane protein YtjA (UPF0391 family)
MFALALLFLVLSEISIVAGFSGIAESFSPVAIPLAFVFLIASMVAFSARWKPSSTCFIYPTFSCSVP